jgi:hypothetical protein
MAALGLIIATFIHYIFNFLVSHQEIFYQKLAFYGTWVGIIIVLLIFELMDRKERYRIIKDGVIYSSVKKINFHKDNPTVDIYLSKKEKITLENEDLEILNEDYGDYKNDSFRKKFF